MNDPESISKIVQSVNNLRTTFHLLNPGQEVVLPVGLCELGTNTIVLIDILKRLDLDPPLRITPFVVHQNPDGDPSFQDVRNYLSQLVGTSHARGFDISSRCPPLNPAYWGNAREDISKMIDLEGNPGSQDEVGICRLCTQARENVLSTVLPREQKPILVSGDTMTHIISSLLEHYWAKLYHKEYGDNSYDTNQIRGFISSQNLDLNDVVRELKEGAIRTDLEVFEMIPARFRGKLSVIRPFGFATQNKIDEAYPTIMPIYQNCPYGGPKQTYRLIVLEDLLDRLKTDPQIEKMLMNELVTLFSAPSLADRPGGYLPIMKFRKANYPCRIGVNSILNTTI